VVSVRVVLIYDITDDRVRDKIANACLDYGLDRLQYSTFTGELAHTHQEELMLRVKKLLGDRPGNVQLIPVCIKDWSARLEVDHA
jgi:CRISPR-associated protein Cas2